MSADGNSGSGSGSSATDSLKGAATGNHEAQAGPSAKTLLTRAKAHDELQKRLEAGRRKKAEQDEAKNRAEADLKETARKLEISVLETKAAEEAKKKVRR